MGAKRPHTLEGAHTLEGTYAPQGSHALQLHPAKALCLRGVFDWDEHERADEED